MLLLQIGFAFSLRVGHFPFVAVAAALALLPAGVWEWFAQRRRSTTRLAGQDHAVSLAAHPVIGFAVLRYGIFVRDTSRPVLPSNAYR